MGSGDKTGFCICQRVVNSPELGASFACSSPSKEKKIRFDYHKEPLGYSGGGGCVTQGGCGNAGPAFTDIEGRDKRISLESAAPVTLVTGAAGAFRRVGALADVVS